MDTRLLINAIVRQTTVLIASLSTASGIRAPLAHVADQVFLNLAKEIESQGVGRKVVADMFGLALRTYQRKVNRLSESVSERNRSLWEAVFQYICEREQVSRKQVDDRFEKDLPEHVAAVLNDLVTSGLIFTTGYSTKAVYRAVSVPNDSTKVEASDSETLANLVWATVYRGEDNTLARICKLLNVSQREIEHALSLLLKDGRVEQQKEADGVRFFAKTLLIPVNARRGWEAAIFDHFSTVATAIIAKVNKGPGSQKDDVIGGATLSFIVHANHPYQKKVYGLLQRIRGEVNQLWNQVDQYNQSHPVPEEEKVKVHFYFGQNVDLKDGPVAESNEKE